MELDFRKILWAFAIFVGATWYVHSHYTFKDVLAYSKEHPNPQVSPALDYYSGMAYYIRDMHDDAIEAFNQLLTDYPTCQYAPTAMVRLGSSYMEKYRYAEARQIFDRYLEEFPDDKDKHAVQEKYEYIKFK